MLPSIEDIIGFFRGNVKYIKKKVKFSSGVKEIKWRINSHGKMEWKSRVSAKKMTKIENPNKRNNDLTWL